MQNKSRTHGHDSNLGNEISAYVVLEKYGWGLDTGLHDLREHLEHHSSSL